MNAFGASFVLLFSAANARRHLTQDLGKKTGSACRCTVCAPCEERRRSPACRRCGMSLCVPNCRGIPAY